MSLIRRTRGGSRFGRTLLLGAVLVAMPGVVTFAQAPAPPAGQGAGARGGRGMALPGATPEQAAAVAAMNATLTEETAAVTAARTELAQATFADPRNAAAVASALDKVRAAELALAMKRAEGFSNLQSGPNRLNADQVAALIAASSNAGRGGPPPAGAGRGRGNRQERQEDHR